MNVLSPLNCPPKSIRVTFLPHYKKVEILRSPSGYLQGGCHPNQDRFSDPINLGTTVKRTQEESMP